MKSLFILSLLVYIVNAQDGMSNLCPYNIFTHHTPTGNSAIVNSVYQLHLNITLDPIGTYSIDEFVDFYDPNLGIDESMAASLEELKKEHNQYLVLMYNQNLFARFEQYKGELYRRFQSTLSKLIYINSRLASNSLAERTVERAIKAVKKTIELHSYLDVLLEPYLHQKVVTISKLTSMISLISLNPKIYYFAFSGEPASSLYSPSLEIFKNKAVEMTKNDGMLIDWRTVATITKIIFLPFQNMQYNEIDNPKCISQIELPGFYKRNDSDDPDYETTTSHY